jgi:hypothetical protein
MVTHPYPVRFEVFTAVRIMMMFLVMAQCRLVGRCQHFGEIYERAESPEDKIRSFYETLASTDESTRRQKNSIIIHALIRIRNHDTKVRTVHDTEHQSK